VRSLITGIGGFAGGHLVAALAERNDPIAGCDFGLQSYPQLAPFRDRIELVEADILDGPALESLMQDFKPEVVFHLAAITHVGQAWQMRRKTLEVNVLGTSTVLEVAARLQPKPKVIVASSGQVYGAAVRDGLPVDEHHATQPLDPYGASKLCTEVLAEQAWRGDGLPTVILRTFNFTGPWQSPTFVSGDFARQVAWAEAGLGPAILTVGNLEARRDFCDVRDIIKGYLLAAEHATAGSVYNLASGQPVRIGAILEYLVEQARVPIEIRQDPSRMRPAEIATLVGDASLAREQIGWQPRIPFEETLAGILDFWRQQAQREAGGGDEPG
jgi:GDP-4-dehydro-6-deoxy-D-mannose reductase